MSYSRYAVDKVTIKQDNVTINNKVVSVEISKSIFVEEETNGKELLYMDAVNSILDTIESLERGQSFDRKNIEVNTYPHTNNTPKSSATDLFKSEKEVKSSTGSVYDLFRSQ